MLTPNAGQRLLVYLPRPGTAAAEKLDLLGVIGTQTLDAADDIDNRTHRPSSAG